MTDFWKKFEKFLGCGIPAVIIKILNATGYECALSLAGMNEDEIQLIEKWVKNRKLDDLFKDSVYVTSDEFKFLPGHQKLLLTIGKEAANYEIFTSNATQFEKESKFPCASFLLKELIDSMENNSNVALRQRRYSEAIQNFAIYIYLLSGKAAYEVLCSNLPLPEVSTICKYRKLLKILY